MVRPSLSEEDIFQVARRIESGEARRAYLDQVCGEDVALREQVEALLGAHDDSKSFLESPASDIVVGMSSPLTIDQPPLDKPGTQIGPYKLLEQIGEGGMGVVYMAEQTEPVERRVALKIIKPGMDTQQVIARFEAEEQALAMMDHPNIAKVFDAGTTDSGRPYFVMELVKGIPITQYCDQQHLTPRERLDLLIPVCQAVQHAHQKGIIHRDLKPSNVLIALYDAQPVPKVIDFGVAKATSQKLTEKTMFTQYGQIVGTLEYMSPEQANLNQLDIDTRSDIYALGVLLYELLTGATPFDRKRLQSAAFEEMLRIIREEEPPKPSTRLSTLDTLPAVAANRHIEPKKLSALVRGELDWIVMKTLEKDRARRYQTASGLAEDIQRFLHDEAVVACPPSAAYRFRKFARRHRGALTTGVLLVAALGMGIAGTVWQARQAIFSRDRALRAEDRAVQNLERALLSVDKMLTRLADEKLANVPFMEEVRHGLLEDALTIYQQLLASGADDPQVQLETAMAQRRLASILIDLGRFQQAEESIQAAIELLTALREQSPDDSRLEFELAQNRILQSRIATNSSESHIAHLQEAAEILDRLLRKDGASREKQDALGRCLSVMAMNLTSIGDLSRSQEAYQKGQSVYEAMLEQTPRDRDVLIAYSKFLQNWGGFSWDSGDLQAAEDKYRRAATVGQSLLAIDPQHATARMVHSTALGSRAGVVMRQRRHQESDALFGEALQMQRDLVRDYPSFPEYRLRLSGTLMSAAGTCSELGEIERGIHCAEEAVGVLEYLTDNWPSVREYQSILGATLSNLAALVQQQGRDLERAEELAQQAIEHQRLAMEDPENPPLYLLQHYYVLADIQMQRGRVQEALATCKEGLQTGQKLVKTFPNSDQVSRLVGKLRKIQEAAGASPEPADRPPQQNGKEEPKGDETSASSAGPADPTKT